MAAARESSSLAIAARTAIDYLSSAHAEPFTGSVIHDFSVRQQQPVKTKVITAALSVMEQCEMVRRSGAGFAMNDRSRWAPKPAAVAADDSSDDDPRPRGGKGFYCGPPRY